MLQISKGIISINDSILFTFPNLIVHSDEIIGIIGDNGAGKTTFFNYIIKNIRRKKLINFNGTYSLVKQIQPTDDMKSGGERTKAAIIESLESHPALLMLDEPSTNLDTTQQVWLKDIINSFNGKLLLITHDESLLNLVNSLWIINDKKLTVYNESYSEFLLNKEKSYKKQLTSYKQQQIQISKWKKQIQKREQRAERLKKGNGRKLSSSEKKAAGMTSHDTMERKMQKSAKSLESRMNRTIKVQRPRTVKPIKFVDPNTKLLDSRTVLNIKDTTIKINDRILIDDVNLKLKYGDHIQITGKNGSGKTTMIKMVLRHKEKFFLNHISIGYFDQNHTSLADKDKVNSLIRASSDQNSQTIFATFSALGIKEILPRKVSELSGGQKVKLQLAKILLGPHQLLILDEPTNYLDLRAKKGLEDFLINYPGTIILINHDIDFTEKLNFKTYNIKNKKLLNPILNNHYSSSEDNNLLLLKQRLGTFITDPNISMEEIKDLQNKIKKLETNR
ncbi:ATP-binding cassette domain-containing protein [Companilactobacillus kimchii]|uniref:ABC transporter domain-containing protein n=2 Tax=Companilactobacillus kimchii TaxID=2801452 RepID=A0ABR5NR58_9LACO|nr:ATP-binding cassette domain-containing protein [Companilactobacillus kimchii]GEO47889.1 ABC transporter ATP-binding protein [Companilactobacillus paralimentarius]KAE9559078.1 hypothetical protein ATN91_12290 [Companilactobacillus kimchii]KAE9560860.1 hypothetical protein ATN91_08645 [Companilactobacillus kimchii]KRK50160.1 hypothetical protein FC97_GL001889 [Companilactobacillus kimchii DSM 13961 = JCM 10707]OWF32195.1 Protein GCN20 [Companilactobacillus kimchii]